MAIAGWSVVGKNGKGESINRYKLEVTKYSLGYKVKHMLY